jgi:predicted transcriptional regulator
VIIFNRFALIEFRRVLGLSQSALSRADDRSQPYISQLESGTSNPSLKTIEGLASPMGIDPRALYVEVPK